MQVYYASCPVAEPLQPSDTKTMLNRALAALAEVTSTKSSPLPRRPSPLARRPRPFCPPHSACAPCALLVPLLRK